MILPSSRQADPNSALLRLRQDAAERLDAAPVAAIVERLATDRPFRIAATVGNNPGAVKKRLQARIGRQVKTADVTSTLLALEAQGKQALVNSIIAVPFVQGNGSDLEKAFQWLKGEVQARIADPNDTAMQRSMAGVQRSGGGAKSANGFGSGPYQEEDEDWGSVPDGQTSGGNTTTGESSGDGFDWTIILNTLPGLVAAFTGGGQGGAPAPTYVAPPKQDNTVLYITIGGMLLVLGAVVYFITRKK